MPTRYVPPADRRSGAALAVAPVHTLRLDDDAGFASMVHAKLPELRAVAEQHYEVEAIERSADAALAMGVHAAARPPTKRAAAIALAAPAPGPAEAAEALPDGSTFPAALSGFGIYGVLRVNSTYYSTNKKYELHADANYMVKIYTTKQRVEASTPAELPKKIIGMAVENDVWGVLLNDANLYERNRNYPLEDLLKAAGPDILSRIKGPTRSDALLCFRDSVLPEVRQSGKLAEVADALEGVRFKSRSESRAARAMTTKEHELFAVAFPGVSDAADASASKRRRVTYAEADSEDPPISSWDGEGVEGDDDEGSECDPHGF